MISTEEMGMALNIRSKCCNGEERHQHYQWLDTDEADRITFEYVDVQAALEDYYFRRTCQHRPMPLEVSSSGRRGLHIVRNGMPDQSTSLLPVGVSTLLASIMYSHTEELSKEYGGIILCLRRENGEWVLKKILHHPHHNAGNLEQVSGEYSRHQLAELLEQALA